MIITIIAMVSLMMGIVPQANAFVVRPPLQCGEGTRSSTRLFLEDWVASLIDRELYRQEHKKMYEAEWMEKNRGAVLSRIESSSSSSSSMSSPSPFDTPVDSPIADSDFRMHRKDQRMAQEDPQRYCADRCIATGNCDIFEDL